MHGFSFCVITILYLHTICCKVFFPRYQCWHNLCGLTSLRSHTLLCSFCGLTSDTKVTCLVCRVYVVQQTINNAFLLTHLQGRLANDNPFLSIVHPSLVNIAFDNTLVGSALAKSACSKLVMRFKSTNNVLGGN